ncbi:hypothetical protein R6Q59_020300 [Mikania micrantha]
MDPTHNNRKSGPNDEMFKNEALMTYAKENGSFSHITVWQVLRKSIKWHPVTKLQISKRTKTSSSGKYMTTQSDSTGRCFINLNESDDEVEMELPPPSPQTIGVDGTVRAGITCVDGIEALPTLVSDEE